MNDLNEKLKSFRWNIVLRMACIILKGQLNINEKRVHNSPIYDECQTQSAKVLALLWEWGYRDDVDDTFQVSSWLRFAADKVN